MRNLYVYLQFLVFSSCLSAKMIGGESISSEDLLFALHSSSISFNKNILKKRTSLPPFPLDIKTFPIRRVQRGGLLANKLVSSFFSNSISFSSTGATKRAANNSGGFSQKMAKKLNSKSQTKESSTSNNLHSSKAEEIPTQSKGENITANGDDEIGDGM